MSKDKNKFKEFFFNNNKNIINKWDHYFEIYDRHFRKYKGQIVVEGSVSLTDEDGNNSFRTQENVDFNDNPEISVYEIYEHYTKECDDKEVMTSNKRYFEKCYTFLND